MMQGKQDPQNGNVRMATTKSFLSLLLLYCYHYHYYYYYLEEHKPVLCQAQGVTYLCGMPVV